jgi:glycosyltransferase involved in cell wall biosynthesis
MPDDAEALAQGIKRALTDEVLSAKITAQAGADVKNYTWQKRAEKIIKFIKNNLK